MRRQRISWGRAFGFSALAVGVPWAICALLASVLIALPGGADPFAVTMVQISPGGAAAGILIGALLAHERPPRTRGGAAGQTLLACVLAIGVVAAVLGVIGSIGSGYSSDLYFAVVAFGFASYVFVVGGGGIWAAAGGTAAVRVLPGPDPTFPRWVPFGWIALGVLAAVGAVFSAAIAPAPTDLPVGVGEPQEVVRGPWRWFPLGWVWLQGIHENDPGWIPTLAFASGLGLIAIGIAMRVGRRPARTGLPSESRR